MLELHAHHRSTFGQNGNHFMTKPETNYTKPLSDETHTSPSIHSDLTSFSNENIGKWPTHRFDRTLSLYCIRIRTAANLGDWTPTPSPLSSNNFLISAATALVQMTLKIKRSTPSVLNQTILSAGAFERSDNRNTNKNQYYKP